MNKIINVRNVSRIYKSGSQDLYANKDISFEIKTGEFVVIFGPSGSGKSTLLNILGGMDIPSSGEVVIDDEDISKYDQKQLSNYRAKKVGFVFQFYNLIPTLTVKENVEIVKSLVDDPLDSEDILSKVGLDDHFSKFPGEISGGEQQRVSIARALTKNPHILLCDEPTGALDSETGASVLRVLQDMCREYNQTIIIVTHNQILSEIADRIIKIKNGQVESNIVNDNPISVDEVAW